MTKLVIVGNTITADILHQYLLGDDRYEVCGFTVDSDFIEEEKKHGLPVHPLESLPSAFPPDAGCLLMAVGYRDLNQTRQRLFDRCKDMGYAIETYVHPDAKIYNDGAIGEGSIVLSNTVVEPYATIGCNSVVWANCVVGHHATLGDHCWVASGTVLAGQATVCNNVFLGVNATISNQVNVQAFNIVGGHCAIHRNTKEHEVYISGQGEKHRFSANDYSTHFLR